MKIKRMISVCFCVVLLAAGFCQAAQDKVDLKLRLKAGESHEIKITQNSRSPGKFPVLETIDKMEMIMDQNVVNVDTNGVMDVEITYKSFKMRSEELRCTSCEDDGMWPSEFTDGEDLYEHLYEYEHRREKKIERVVVMEYDSTNTKKTDAKDPAQKIINAAFSAMAGSKFHMKITPTGKIYEMDSDTNLPNKKQLKESLKSITGEFPAEPVAVGDTWHDTRSINSPSPMSVDTTYTLKQRKDGIAYIDAIAKMDMGDSSKKIFCTMNSANEMDEKTGLVRKSNMTTHFSGGMKMEAKMIIELIK